ncbi:MAG: carboxypeptidase-like regulatory domain-containing protein [Bryobacteraceae bacterium]
MKRVRIFMLAATLASAAIDGTVKNGTTGKAQPGVSVTLIRLGSGMNTVGTVKSDASGKFRFDLDLEAGFPNMLQALHDGVSYSRVLPPGSAATAIELTVHNASTSPGTARVATHDPARTDGQRAQSE